MQQLFNSGRNAIMAQRIQRLNQIRSMQNQFRRHARPVALVILQIMCFGCFSIVFGLCSYLMIYILLIPKLQHSFPVEFDYNMFESPENGVYKRQPAQANVNLLSCNSQWVSFFEDDCKSKLLAYNQPYDVSLDLVIPESHTNKDIALFHVQVQAIGSKDEEVGVSRRSVRMKYSSFITKVIRFPLEFWPRFFGFIKDEQTLVIDFMNGLKQPRNHLIKSFNITIVPPIEVYSANLRIDAHLSGIRYWMVQWFFSGLVVFSSQIASSTFVCLMILYVIYKYFQLKKDWSSRTVDMFPPPSVSTVPSFTTNSHQAGVVSTTSTTATSHTSNNNLNEPSTTAINASNHIVVEPLVSGEAITTSSSNVNSMRSTRTVPSTTTATIIPVHHAISATNLIPETLLAPSIEPINSTESPFVVIPAMKMNKKENHKHEDVVVMGTPIPENIDDEVNEIVDEIDCCEELQEKVRELQL
eukprot:TRINITY_DN87068_c0_g3_i1.p1 TRINITY_DN87068_c0_g3~~TRINITY_DN87068_c0_g3_i1.p1  ORF type:complete len:470 (-),score=83.44 TRINITY_DN87068_c0_g3_i1:188-1597(-)